MAEPSPPTDSLTAHVRIPVGERFLDADITVPRADVKPVRLLPVLQSFTDSVVSIAIQDSETRGLAISCRKGCGACCRQVVPISELETHQIKAVLDSIPEPRRSVVLARFRDGLERLQEAGLLEKLRHKEGLSGPERRELALGYFGLGIACPFLEDESCSIHPDRPVACREYLVTSPAAECAEPTSDTVKRVPMPVKVSLAMFRSGQPASRREPHWVPLILALEWVDSHPEPGPRPAPEILEEVLKNLARTRS
jgi:Fe-S-cluster containining protein